MNFKKVILCALFLGATRVGYGGASLTAPRYKEFTVQDSAHINNHTTLFEIPGLDTLDLEDVLLQERELFGKRKLVPLFALTEEDMAQLQEREQHVNSMMRPIIVGGCAILKTFACAIDGTLYGACAGAGMALFRNTDLGIIASTAKGAKYGFCIGTGLGAFYGMYLGLWAYYRCRPGYREFRRENGKVWISLPYLDIILINSGQELQDSTAAAGYRVLEPDNRQ